MWVPEQEQTPGVGAGMCRAWHASALRSRKQECGGGIGAGDKRAKVLPASRAFLSLPSSLGAELSGLALPGLPGT